MNQPFPERPDLLRAHCQRFSRLGWALFAQMAAMLAVQLGAGLLLPLLAPSWRTSPLFLWCLSVGSAYGAGVPAFCLVLRGTPGAADKPVRPCTPRDFLRWLVITLGVVYAANLVTLMLTHLIGQLRGAPVVNPVDSLNGYPVILNLLLGCVIAPLAEEYLFRGLLLDRLRPYGDRFAILASALCFGLFHGTLNQLLYAVGVGMLLAYVTLYTGRLRYTMLLHALLNFTSVGLVPLLDLWGQTGEALLDLLVLGSMVVGLPLFRSEFRRTPPDPGSVSLSTGWKWRLFFENPGMLFFCILSVLLICFNLG